MASVRFTSLRTAKAQRKRLHEVCAVLGSRPDGKHTQLPAFISAIFAPRKEGMPRAARPDDQVCMHANGCAGADRCIACARQRLNLQETADGCISSSKSTDVLWRGCS